MSSMIKSVLISVVLLWVAGCEQTKDKLRRNTFVYEGVSFRTKIEKSKEDRQAFRIIVRDAGKGLTGAKEAARVAAHRYCIDNYGLTDITYLGQGPETPNDELKLDNSQLVIEGRCPGW